MFLVVSPKTRFRLGKNAYRVSHVGELFLGEALRFSVGADVVRENLRQLPARFSKLLLAHMPLTV